MSLEVPGGGAGFVISPAASTTAATHTNTGIERHASAMVLAEGAKQKGTIIYRKLFKSLHIMVLVDGAKQ